MKYIKRLAMAATLMAGAASAQTQGVSDDEIVIGSVNDLSGIFAAVGVPATKGANLMFDKVNAAGGIHGRQIRFVVEDNGYQMPRAMQGYNKLLNRDKVFAMLLSLGTPMNLAGFRLMDPKGIPNVGPLSASKQMLQEPMENKFIAFSNYFDQTNAGVTYLAGEFGGKEVCAMYLPTDFGLEIKEGAEHAAGTLGLTFASETTHKPDETDFVGALSKLAADGCDIVAMALGVRQGITVVATAKKMGLNDIKFLNTSAGFLGVIAAVPGGVTEGLYAASGWQDLASRASDPVPAAFIAEYSAKYGEMPSGFAMLGYSAAEQMVKGLEAAGPDLTHAAFIAGMESLDYDDALTGTAVSYGPGDHRAADDIIISVVENGAWKMVDKK